MSKLEDSIPICQREFSSDYLDKMLALPPNLSTYYCISIYLYACLPVCLSTVCICRVLSLNTSYKEVRGQLETWFFHSTMNENQMYVDSFGGWCSHP